MGHGQDGRVRVPGTDLQQSSNNASTELRRTSHRPPSRGRTRASAHSRPGNAPRPRPASGPTTSPTSTSSSAASETGSRPSSDDSIAAVSAARRNGLVYRAAKRSPPSSSASARACARPASLSGGSAWPWKRLSRFQSVSPCLMRTRVVGTPDTVVAWISARRETLPRHRLDRWDRPRGRRQLAGEGAPSSRAGGAMRRRRRGGARRRRPVTPRRARTGRLRGCCEARRARRPRQQRRHCEARALRGCRRRRVGRVLAAERHELRASDSRGAAVSSRRWRRDRERVLDGGQAAVHRHAALLGDEGGGALAVPARRRPVREGRHPLQRRHARADRDRRLARRRRARGAAGRPRRGAGEGRRGPAARTAGAARRRSPP